MLVPLEKPSREVRFGAQSNLDTAKKYVGQIYSTIEGLKGEIDKAKTFFDYSIQIYPYDGLVKEQYRDFKEACKKAEEARRILRGVINTLNKYR